MLHPKRDAEDLPERVERARPAHEDEALSVLEIALACLPCAALVVDADGTILRANRAGSELLGLNLAFTVDPLRRLRLIAAAEDDELRRAFGEAQRRPGHQVRWPTTSPRRAETAAIVSAHLVALPSHAQILALLFDSRQPFAGTPDRLGALLGLSPVESRLAAALARGESLNEASATAGVRISSARTYMKRIFEKTGTRRQAQLVGLICRAVATDPGRAS